MNISNNTTLSAADMLAQTKDALADMFSLNELSVNERERALHRVYTLVLHEALASVIDAMDDEEAKALSELLEKKPREDVLIGYLLDRVLDFDLILQESATQLLLDVHARMYLKEDHERSTTSSA